MTVYLETMCVRVSITDRGQLAVRKQSHLQRRWPPCMCIYPYWSHAAAGTQPCRCRRRLLPSP